MITTEQRERYFSPEFMEALRHLQAVRQTCFSDEPSAIETLVDLGDAVDALVATVFVIRGTP